MSKIFKQIGNNSFKLKNENDDMPIYIDRHGSLPDRPKDIKFKKADDYNKHMGFDAELPSDLDISPEQIVTVKRLMKRGYQITGHSKWPDNPKQIEILMTLKTGTGSIYADIAPNGKIL